MTNSIILPIIIAVGAIAFPVAVEKIQAKPQPEELYRTHEENLNIWIQRHRCNRFYTIEMRGQCYAMAMKHSEHELSKKGLTDTNIYAR